MYRIAGNFHLEKIFAFFAQVHGGRKFFSANYFTQWNFHLAEIFTHGCQAVLVVPHDHQAAVLLGIQNLFFLDLQPSLMSLLSYFHISPWVLPDPAGPLLLELSPSVIAEANAAVNGMQQAKTKETKRREIDRAEECACYTCVWILFWPRCGVFIRELRPLLPGEQLTLWAKLNSAKFLCQYKVWALSEIFIQQKFCAIR